MRTTNEQILQSIQGSSTGRATAHQLARFTRLPLETIDAAVNDLTACGKLRRSGRHLMLSTAEQVIVDNTATIMRVHSELRELPVSFGGQRVENVSDAARVLRTLIALEPIEVFVALMVDGKHRITAVHEVSRGTLTCSLVHPREVFRPAIQLGAAAIIVGHNHPSGDPEPSTEDSQVTERLRGCGELVGIPIVDHIVIGRREHVSFSQRGWMRP